MRAAKCLTAALLGLGLLASPGASASADVTAGDVINKDSWQKAEGLLPEPVLNWIKKGDVLEVGQLSYDPGEFLPPAALESLQTNIGRYDIDENGTIIDKSSRKLPDFISGLPFPQIDPNDPQAAPKIMHNKNYYTYACGNLDVPFQTTWIGRSTGAERKLDCQYLVYVMDGDPIHKDESNTENIEVHSIIRILAPFDIAGTNVLLWRYRDDRSDSSLTYVPSIRRVRRMSPANRSDAFVGSDFCVDDAWGYAGKVGAFDWKILRKEDQLVPFYPKDPLPLEKQADGSFRTINPGKQYQPLLGMKKEGYTGAPWFPTNIVVVKRPTYVIECKAKDPYYNYGVQYLWVDAEFYQPSWKVIHDRSGTYWKVEWQPQVAFESADKKVRLIGLACMLAVDDRSDHACFIDLVHPNNQTDYWDAQDKNDYSIAGFQKLCK
ncbi:MAG: outer membrane lipoprotein-sorting protein [bacterium]